MLVLDDFEVNLEARGESYVLQPEAASVLEALIWSIRDLNAPHRLILTSRYDFEFTQLQYFYKQPLDAFRGADLRKKCDRLDGFNSKSQIDKTLQAKAIRLTDGNPRLLEYLSNEVLQNSTTDPITTLNQLETDSTNLRKQVLADSLLNQINQPMQEVLQRALIFELPVPREAIAAICETVSDSEKSIDRVISLGLLEVSPDRSLRVPRILPLQLPIDNQFFYFYKQATIFLYQLWWESRKALEEEQLSEIHRLALISKEVKIAVKISENLSGLWNRHSRYIEVVNLCNKTLALSRDYRILDCLAWAELMLERPEALNHFQEALQNFPENGDKSIQACIMSNFSDLLERRGQIDEAFDLLQQALEVYKKTNDTDDIFILLRVARIHTHWGNIDEALDILQRILEISEGNDFLTERAFALEGISHIFRLQVKYEEAIELLQEALGIHIHTGRTQGQIAVLHTIGRIYIQKGQTKKALAFLQQALILEEQTGCIKDKASTLNEIGRIYSRHRQFDEAASLFQQSLEISRAIGSAQDEAATLHELAIISLEKGEAGEVAIDLFKQSLAIERRIGNLEGEAITLAELGKAFLITRNDFRSALIYFKKAQVIFQRLKSPKEDEIKQTIAFVQQRSQSQPKKNKKRNKKDWMRLNLE